MKYLVFILPSILLFQCRKSPEPSAVADSIKVEEKKEVIAIIGEQSQPDSLRGSVKASATETFQGSNVSINYYSPAVRGRIIWGGLVPLDKVWVTGAHNATYIETDQDLIVNGTRLTKGKYGFFTIPGRDQWKVIFNTRWRQHLADSYNEKEDVLRITVEPDTATPHQERLRYWFNKKSETAGELILHWEKVRLTIPFEVGQP